MSNPKPLVPVFIPSLSAVLLAAEDKKGAPLTESEVIQIRDKSPCIMMEREDAAKLVESRGYRDVDPENCWHDWQMVRRELGREPDLPAGPKFFQVPRNDTGFQRTIDEAQETLDEFRRLIEEFRETDVMPMIKVAIYEDDNRAFMWICNLKETAEGFSGELFEVPSHFKSYAVGDRVSAAEREILDWMVNKHGILYGGFSLRYQRAEMTPEEQQEFDDYIGVSDYVPLEHGDR